MIEYREIGSRKLKLSRMCFGTLTMGPLQAKLPVDAGAELIVEACKLGINFLDSAELYDNYQYIKRAIDQLEKQDWPHLMTKSYAYTKDMMKASLDKALVETGLDKISIFLLHEQESIHTLKGHREAYDYLLEAKEARLIDAVGISCHSIEAVRAAINLDGIDVIMPIYNQAGIGIIDGNREEMLEAIADARKSGISIVGMKALAGGHLIGRAQHALQFALDCQHLDSIAVGIQNLDELKYNYLAFTGQNIPEDLANNLRHNPRKLLIEEWCDGCGECVKRCSANALMLYKGKATVDPGKCRLCSYCGTVCPNFYIKVL